MGRLFSFTFVLFLSLILLVGCYDSIDDSYNKFDSSLAYKLTQESAEFGSRPSGSKQIEKQCAFIAAKAEAFGADTVEVQEFLARTPLGEIEFRNVIAEIEGDSTDFIVVGCHYDTKLLESVPDFQGANDGASGVGVLLAMIKAISDSPSKPPCSIRFLFFDGEECFFAYTPSDGLFGSKYYVQSIVKNGDIKRCRATVILDMIGDRDLRVSLPSGSDSHLVDALLSIADKKGYGKFFRQVPYDIIDDHTPFQNAGVPVVDIIDFEYGRNNCFWHTAEDSIDKISEESLEITGSVALSLIWNILYWMK